ncbi:MAG TPA: class I SAM-dependent methyltransferase [Opitutaceae bacterium]|nr:class I SAM-dependent methyltransferase [Opitutaceae bacterium]
MSFQLWKTRRHWEAFARTDPLWAVLTEPDRRNNRWTIDEFFATGRRVVDNELAHLREHYPALRRQRALDFGCGVGRLTQALANHFDTVTGADISTAMLALAREHNRQGARVSYVHNTRPDLSIFPDASFDFVCSLITLQHIPPVHARTYIAEFLRVCAPGGAVLFQMPRRLPPRDPPERLQFSAWPPTLWMRVRRYVRYHFRLRFPGGPVMEMHAMAREEVLALLAAAGGELVAEWPDEATDPAIASYSYLVRKP